MIEQEDLLGEACLQAREWVNNRYRIAQFKARIHADKMEKRINERFSQAQLLGTNEILEEPNES